MALFSKMHAEVAHTTCEKLIHPFTSTCAYGTLDMFFAATYGSAKFFAIIYSLHFLLKLAQDRERAKKEFISIKTLKSYCQSVSYASTAGTIFVTANCLSRLLVGGYNEFNCCFFSSFIAGLAILLEAPSRRRLVITSYANMALDCLLRRLEELGVLQWSNTKFTLGFMILNAYLMYCLRFPDPHQQSFWFFTPQKETEIWANENSQKKLMHLFGRFFSTGLALSGARLIFSDLTLLKNPLRFFSKLLSYNNISLGAFLGCYVTVFQIFDMHFKENSNLDISAKTILGGLLSGVAFRLLPSRTIFISLSVNVFQIVLQRLQNRGRIPRLPYEEFLFCCYNGFLYHARAMNPSAVPRTFIRIMSLVTSKRSDYIYGYYAKFAKTL